MTAPASCFERVSCRIVRERVPETLVSRMRGPEDVVAAFRSLVPADTDREHFVVLFLDSQNRIASGTIATVGLLNASLVHPREVFKPAILASAASIILVHNHPSGDPEPSPEDLRVTEQIVEAGRIIGIPVRDHVIVGDGTETHVSLQARGVINGGRAIS